MTTARAIAVGQSDRPHRLAVTALHTQPNVLFDVAGADRLSCVLPNDERATATTHPRPARAVPHEQAGPRAGRTAGLRAGSGGHPADTRRFDSDPT